MIKKEVVLTIQNGKSSRLSEPIILYKGDTDILLDVEIREIGFQFSQFPHILSDVYSDFTSADLLLKFESGKKAIIAKKGTCTGNRVQVVLTNAIDEDDEIGMAKAQFVLYDGYGGCITIPDFEVDVRERVVDANKDEFTYLPNKLSNPNFSDTEMYNHGEVAGNFTVSSDYLLQKVTVVDDTMITLPTTPRLIGINLFLEVTTDYPNITLSDGQIYGTNNNFIGVEHQTWGINNYKVGYLYHMIFVPATLEGREFYIVDCREISIVNA